jgi:putative oxidoreductase
MTTPEKVLISRKLDRRVGKTVSALLRFALGAGLISAVAHRLGLWGAPGSSSVTWGNMANFETYTKKLAPWCPGVILPTLAWGVTIAELVLGLLLIVGLWRKPTAVLAALLTLSFALSMTVLLGPHEPLNYSVFVFAFASLYLGLSQDVE